MEIGWRLTSRECRDYLDRAVSGTVRNLQIERTNTGRDSMIVQCAIAHRLANYDSAVSIYPCLISAKSWPARQAHLNILCPCRTIKAIILIDAGQELEPHGSVFYSNLSAIYEWSLKENSPVATMTRKQIDFAVTERAKAGPSASGRVRHCHSVGGVSDKKQAGTEGHRGGNLSMPTRHWTHGHLLLSRCAPTPPQSSQVKACHSMNQSSLAATMGRWLRSGALPANLEKGLLFAANE